MRLASSALRATFEPSALFSLFSDELPVYAGQSRPAYVKNVVSGPLVAFTRSAKEKPRLFSKRGFSELDSRKLLLFDLMLLGDALELRQDPGVERVRRGVRDLPYGKFSLTMALASETVEPDVP